MSKYGDYEKMNMTQLMRHINRLEWAANTEEDYKWKKVHLYYREGCIQLLLKRFLGD